LEASPSARRDPQVGMARVDAPTAVVEHSPHPRNEVAPVVEVEVRDRDRVEVGPPARNAKRREDAGAAVEQEPSRALDQVAGLGAAGVRPRGRGADDGDLHGRMLAGREAFVAPGSALRFGGGAATLEPMVVPGNTRLSIELTGSLALALLLP